MTDHTRSGPVDEIADAAPTADQTHDGSSQSPETVDAAELARARDEYRDLLLRKTAEFDNYRKRTERERRELVETAGADVLTELLPLLDDLERALQTEPASEDHEAYRRGVELIHQQLLQLLKRRGVTRIEAVGQDFDPHLHQALVYEPIPGRRDGEVVEELRRGYKLGDRLLRPAFVRVAKA